MNPPSVGELLEPAGNGDRAAINALVTRLYPLVRALFCRWSRQRDVDDLVQDVFVVFCRRQPILKAEGPAQLSSWLWKVAWNIWRAHLHSRRRQRPWSEAELADIAGREPEPSEGAADEERSITLLTLMAELRPEHEQVLEFYYLDGLSHKAIAERLGSPEGTIRWRAAQARAELRRRIQASAPELMEWINRLDESTGVE